MINNDRLVKQLVVHEGLKLEPYKCTSNKLTIGVGRNLDDLGISKDEAEYMLKNDILRVQCECMSSFLWFDRLSSLRKEAIINLVFNMGITKFKQFKKTIAYIESGDFDLAGAELLNSRYADQVGQRAIDVANQLSSNKSQSHSL